MEEWNCLELDKITHETVKAWYPRHLSHVMRKPSLGLCKQVRLKPAYSATQPSKSHEIANKEIRDIILSRQWTTKALIRLRGCTGWSAPLLFAYGINRFSHDMAHLSVVIWTASSEFGTYSLCEQRRFRRACASAWSRQNLRCSLIQAVNQEEPSDRKPDPWPLWMAEHAQLKFVMTECSKTQIRLTGLIY